MNKIFFPLLLLVFILFLFSTSCSNENNKNTINIKKGLVGMIGYGTLMSLPSLEQTLEHKYNDSIYQVHLIGYKREWTYFRPINNPQEKSKEGVKYYGFFLNNNDTIPFDGMVNLNIEPGENSTMNCILYFITENDLIKLDKREFGYKKVEVTSQIEEYNFNGGKVYVYKHFPERNTISSINTDKYILVKEYVDFITTACDSIGRNFRSEFDKSTKAPITKIVTYKNIIWKNE